MIHPCLKIIPRRNNFVLQGFRYFEFLRSLLDRLGFVLDVDTEISGRSAFDLASCANVNADGPIAMDFFLLPVSIEVARQEGNAPALPHEIEDEYHAAIRELGPLARNYTSHIKVIDQTMRKVTRAAELVSDGLHQEAAALIEA